MIQSVLSEKEDRTGTEPSQHVEKTPVFIVGAGPYGISIALELYHHQVPFVICGDPFSLWFKHTLRDVRLRSDLRASQIFTRDGAFDLHDFLVREYDEKFAWDLHMKRVPVEVFRAYLTDLLSRLPFTIKPELVTALEKNQAGFEVSLQDGERYQTDQVILASGLSPHRHFPKFLQALNPACISHGWFTQNYEPLENKRIMVVGRGQSAGEAIWHLQKKNDVTWVYRSEPEFFADPIALPPFLFKAALEGSTVFSRMPSALRGWLGEKFVGTSMTPDLEESVVCVEAIQADAQNLGLEDSQENGLPTIFSSKLDRHFDYVVSCTGYKLNLSNLKYLSTSIAEKLDLEKGLPVLGHDFQTSVPNLYVAGGMTEPFHGPAQRFMLGAKNAALAIGASIRRNYAAKH